MQQPLNYERNDPNQPRRRWSIPAIIGLPLGIGGPIGAIMLAFALRTGTVVLLAPLSILGALVCSLIGARDTNPEAANMPHVSKRPEPLPRPRINPGTVQLQRLKQSRQGQSILLPHFLEYHSL